MAKFKVRDSDPGFRKFKRQLQGGPNAVNIGLFGEQGSDLVIYAASNEFGTEKIPERSFLRSIVDEKRREFRKFIDKNKVLIVQGPLQRRQVLTRLGLLAEKEIVMKIDRGPFVPNRPSTIARKGSSKPLIDTGRMRGSVISKVVTK